MPLQNMNLTDIRLGEPTQCGSLDIFPLFCSVSRQTEYLLADEGIVSGYVVVKEVSETGDVRQLLVDNRSDRKVLFVEGMELCGGKQDRIVIASSFVEARSQTILPVACVEPNRWKRTTPRLVPGAYATPSLRYLLKADLWESFRANRGRSVNQQLLWLELSRRRSVLKLPVRVTDLPDSDERHRERIDSARNNVPYISGASGVAVSIAGHLIAVDILDAPATCERLWEALIESVAMESLEVPNINRRISPEDVSGQLYRLGGFDFQKVESCPVVDEYRAEGERNVLATALVVEGTLVHLSVSALFSPASPSPEA